MVLPQVMFVGLQSWAPLGQSVHDGALIRLAGEGLPVGFYRPMRKLAPEAEPGHTLSL